MYQDFQESIPRFIHEFYQKFLCRCIQEFLRRFLLLRFFSEFLLKGVHLNILPKVPSEIPPKFLHGIAPTIPSGYSSELSRMNPGVLSEILPGVVPWVSPETRFGIPSEIPSKISLAISFKIPPIVPYGIRLEDISDIPLLVFFF